MRLVPQFPPLMTGMAAGPADPFVVACDQAQRGVDAGLLVWSLGDTRLRAALVLAPETPLRAAMGGLVAASVGLQGALGALAPAETAVHLEWSGGLRINGARCGGFTAAAAPCPPDEVPGWLVTGLDLTLRHSAEAEPGTTPDITALEAEDCHIDPLDLLEAWARHTLLWLTELETPEGRARLHTEWSGLLWREDTPGILGCDEDFGLLVKTGAGATLRPLSDVLKEV